MLVDSPLVSPVSCGSHAFTRDSLLQQMADISGNGVNTTDSRQCVVHYYCMLHRVLNVSHMLEEFFKEGKYASFVTRARDLESFIVPCICLKFLSGFNLLLLVRVRFMCIIYVYLLYVYAFILFERKVIVIYSRKVASHSIPQIF